jgi:hypothetical protein
MRNVSCGRSGKSGGRVGGLTGGGSFWALWPFGRGIASLLKTFRLTRVGRTSFVPVSFLARSIGSRRCAARASAGPDRVGRRTRSHQAAKCQALPDDPSHFGIKLAGAGVNPCSQQPGSAMTARVLAAIVFLLIPTLAPAQVSQTQRKTDLARNEAGKPSPSEKGGGNASDGNGAVTPTNKGVDPGSDANATTAPSSKPPIAVRGDAPM